MTGGHIGFSQYGDPWCQISWRPQKIEKVWYKEYLDQIWCFWKNLNQTTPMLP